MSDFEMARIIALNLLGNEALPDEVELKRVAGTAILAVKAQTGTEVDYDARRQGIGIKPECSCWHLPLPLRITTPITSHGFTIVVVQSSGALPGAINGY